MKALLLRDLRLAFRAGGGFGLSLAFFLIVIVLVPFAVGPESAILSRIGPGILWVAALLATLLSLDRQFALDHEDGRAAPHRHLAPAARGRGPGQGPRPLAHHGLPLTLAARPWACSSTSKGRPMAGSS
jgi:heme exporter protein B